MADNFLITQGAGTTIATDQAAGGEHYQKIKLIDPTADSTTGIGILSNPIRTNPTGSNTVSATLSALDAAVTLDVRSQRTVGFTTVNTSFTATLRAEMSFDNGVTWTFATFLSPSNLIATSDLGFNASSSTVQHHIVTFGGATHVRVRVQAFTSGSTAAVLFSTDSAPSHPLVYAKDRVNSTIYRPILCEANGELVTVDAPINLVVSTTAATGVAVTATLAAVASQFHYILAIEFTKYFTAANAASATPLVVTTTNLSGSLAFSFGQPLGTIGTSETRILSFSNPIKSSVANTNTTIVCPATVGIIWRVNVFYYTAQ